MQQLRFQHGQRSPLLPKLRSEALSRVNGRSSLRRAWGLALTIALLCSTALGSLGWCGSADAAEVLQVRAHASLQVGDGNRSYPVTLACIRIPPEQEQAATEWLRRELPRHSRVNLRPFGTADGTLVARVSRLTSEGGSGDPLDLGKGLVEAGLASISTESDAGCPEVG